jgi:mannose-6-phosphate isomerase-like protein (cupin superfamily)
MPHDRKGKGIPMNSDSRPGPGSGFVVAADEGQPFWFLNTLTINKVGSADSQGLLSVVDHRVPPGFAPPPHIHLESDETFFIIDGEFEGFCGDQAWSAGPGSLVYLPRRVPHGFSVSDAGPGRTIIVTAPGGFDELVAALGEPAADLRLPEPVPPDPARIAQLAAAHGIQVLPPPQP